MFPKYLHDKGKIPRYKKNMSKNMQISKNHGQDHPDIKKTWAKAPMCPGKICPWNACPARTKHKCFRFEGQHFMGSFGSHSKLVLRQLSIQYR